VYREKMDGARGGGPAWAFCKKKVVGGSEISFFAKIREHFRQNPKICGKQNGR
jgi:hypothetical protein